MRTNCSNDFGFEQTFHSQNVIASHILKKILHWIVHNYKYVDWLAVEKGVCYNL